MLRALFISLSLAGVSASALPAQESKTTYDAGAVEVGGTRIPYQLLRPAKLEDGKSYPLILFLHGAGERGDNNEAQKRHFPERMQEAMEAGELEGFVLAPQCPRGVWWSERPRDRGLRSILEQPAGAPMQGAMQALAEVVQAYPIDRERIALTGLSMGGFGTWELAARRPGWFSVAMPICGGGDPRTVAQLAGLPVHVWHGDADTVVPPDASRAMVRALRQHGLPVSYRELPGVGHASWVQAYRDADARRTLWESQRDPAGRAQAAAAQLARVVDTEERVAFLGDSITQAGARPGGYVDLVRQGLATHASEAAVIPAGISGHKVPNLLARVQKDVIDQKATIVFIYIGINDVWHSVRDQGTPKDVFEAGLHELIDGLQATGAEVVLATPSVIGEKTPGTNQLDAMLEEYADLSRRVAAEQDLVLCDLRQEFLEHLRIFGDPTKDRGCLTTDGVHLNPAGNQLVAIASAQALREALERRAERREAATAGDATDPADR